MDSFYPVPSTVFYLFSSMFLLGLPDQLGDLTTNTLKFDNPVFSKSLYLVGEKQQAPYN
jgi:hypothetical protein